MGKPLDSENCPPRRGEKREKLGTDWKNGKTMEKSLFRGKRERERATEAYSCPYVRLHMVAAGNRVVFKPKRAFRVPSVSSWSQPRVGATYGRAERNNKKTEEKKKGRKRRAISCVPSYLSLSLCRSRR